MAEGRPLMNTDQTDSAGKTPAFSSLGFAPRHQPFGYEQQPDVYVSPPASPHVPQAGRPNVERGEAVQEQYGGDVPNTNRLPPGSPGNAAPAVSPIENQQVPVQTIHPNTVGQNNPTARGHDIVSPLSTGNSLFGGFPQDSANSTPDLRRDRFSRQADQGRFDDVPTQPYYTAPTPSNDYHQFLQTIHHPKGTSVRSGKEDFRPTAECPTAKDIHMGRFSWVSVSIILICLFSCVFSGIFLGLAIKGPRYGRAISSQGSFKPSDAMLLTTIMAKLIELSFVTVFVAFLGQVLSRRAFMREGKGISISEMSMWRWVVQPGTLITHWEVAKYAGLTVLGILSLLSAILATLYTSAATAVVQPILKDGKWDSIDVMGLVKADFAHIEHIGQVCETPITAIIDKNHSQGTCLQIEHAGNAYYNYQRYLSDWKTALTIGNTTSDQHKRPRAHGILHENTTIIGQWIDIVDTPKVSKDYRRVVNNVSLAFPHAGVFQAARDQRNDIMQPEELDSEGTYTLRASVVSPVMNVLCANMEEKELVPIVYQKWNNAQVNGTSWIDQRAGLMDVDNKTKVDDLFGWTKQLENFQDYPPIFAKLPLSHNTIMNHTNFGYGRDSVYLLGRGGEEDNKDIYVLCKIHLSITPRCSTHYTATGSGGTMEAHCEDSADEMSYSKTHPEAPYVKSIPNWKDIAMDWANSLSLNTGIDDANASNARLLTQLILKPTRLDSGEVEVDLDPKLPSAAEALAVMAGNTLLKSTLMAPYVHEWEYGAPYNMPEPKSASFRASIKAQQYASGGVDNASKGWIVVLFLVFIMNIIVLVYFICHNGIVTDFSEPPTLFALAVNSPPSHVLAGSCGGGPRGKQYTVNWFVNQDGDHLFMEPKYGQDLDHEKHGHVHVHDNGHTYSHGNGHTHTHQSIPQNSPPLADTNNDPFEQPPPASPGRSSVFSGITERFKGRDHQSRPMSIARSPQSPTQSDMEGNTSRARKQYDKLASRRSVLF